MASFGLLVGVGRVLGILFDLIFPFYFGRVLILIGGSDYTGIRKSLLNILLDYTIYKYKTTNMIKRKWDTY